MIIKVLNAMEDSFNIETAGKQFYNQHLSNFWECIQYGSSFNSLSEDLEEHLMFYVSNEPFNLAFQNKWRINNTIVKKIMGEQTEDMSSIIEKY